MDLMTDDELMAIIGHEIGHIVHRDSKDVIRTCLHGSAARNAAGAAGGTVGTLSESQLGDLAQAFTGAQFSQKQEYAADEYGFDFCVAHGFSPHGMGRRPRQIGRICPKAPGIRGAADVLVASRQRKTAARMKEKPWLMKKG